MPELVERRRSRSPYRGEAADLYLRALSERHGLGAVVVADELGLPIAASGPARAREVLSTYGVLRAAAAPGACAAGEAGDRFGGAPPRRLPGQSAPASAAGSCPGTPSPRIGPHPRPGCGVPVASGAEPLAGTALMRGRNAARLPPGCLRGPAPASRRARSVRVPWLGGRALAGTERSPSGAQTWAPEQPATDAHASSCRGRSAAGPPVAARRGGPATVPASAQRGCGVGRRLAVPAALVSAVARG
jgi:hypothetical protein